MRWACLSRVAFFSVECLLSSASISALGRPNTLPSSRITALL